MDVPDLHGHLISGCTRYTKSFMRILGGRIREAVEYEIGQGLLWPERRLRKNPSFERGATIHVLVTEGVQIGWQSSKGAFSVWFRRQPCARAQGGKS